MRIIDADKYRKELLSAYDDVSMEFEVLDKQPLVQAISLDKVKQVREEIEKLEVQIQSYHNDDPMISQSDVLAILDKLIEGVE